jgi:hypothetical protein
MLDPRLLQRPANLGRLLAVDLAGLRRVEVMRRGPCRGLIGRPCVPNTSFSARKVEAVPSSSTKKAE